MATRTDWCTIVSMTEPSACWYDRVAIVAPRDVGSYSMGQDGDRIASLAALCLAEAAHHADLDLGLGVVQVRARRPS
jgi:hypothetical protein